jgi:chemotaxis signal transduction protein
MRYLEFTLARERYALPIAAVQEVTEVAGLLRVPRAPAAIAGLTDVRGRVITLVDLGRVFDAGAEAGGGTEAGLGAEAGAADPPVALILAPPDSHIGLLVRGQPQVTRLDPSAAQPGDGLVEGIVAADRGVTNIVNPRRVLDYCERQVLDVFKLAGAESRPAPTGRKA